MIKGLPLIYLGLGIVMAAVWAERLNRYFDTIMKRVGVTKRQGLIKVLYTLAAIILWPLMLRVLLTKRDQP